MLKNVLHASLLAKTVVAMAYAELGDEHNPLLFPLPEPGMYKSIIDITVYSRNRNFRMPECIKARKAPTPAPAVYPLKRVCTCACDPADACSPADATGSCGDRGKLMAPVFMSYLVTYVPRNAETGEPVEVTPLVYRDTRPRMNRDIPSIFGMRTIAGAGGVEPGAGAMERFAKRQRLQEPAGAGDDAHSADEMEIIPRPPPQKTTLHKLAYEVARQLNVLNPAYYAEIALGGVRANGSARITTRFNFCHYLAQSPFQTQKHDNNRIFFVAYLHFPTPVVKFHCHSRGCQATDMYAHKIHVQVPEAFWQRYTEMMREFMYTAVVTPSLLFSSVFE
jgi:hypothetical protein